MSLCITIPELNKLKPCPEAGRRVRAALKKLNADNAYCFSAADARSAGCSYDDVIWAASALAMNDDDIARRLTGFLNDNAKRVLHIFEEAAPDDMRVRQCIQATDDWLAGKITEDQWREAARAARAARDARAAWFARDARDARDARAAARDAWAARAARAAWAARDAWFARDARDARDARAAARDAWAARAARAAWAARDARDEFEKWQFDRLVEWLLPVAPEPLAMPELKQREAG